MPDSEKQTYRIVGKTALFVINTNSNASSAFVQSTRVLYQDLICRLDILVRLSFDGQECPSYLQVKC